MHKQQEAKTLKKNFMHCSIVEVQYVVNLVLLKKKLDN